MYFVISCHDKPGHEALRQQTRPEHLEYIAGLEARIKIAGPMLTKDNNPCGSLLIVEAVDLAEVERFVQHDPYSKVGLFDKVTIMPFRPAVGDWIPAKLHP